MHVPDYVLTNSAQGGLVMKPERHDNHASSTGRMIVPTKNVLLASKGRSKNPQNPVNKNNLLQRKCPNPIPKRFASAASSARPLRWWLPPIGKDVSGQNEKVYAR